MTGQRERYLRSNFENLSGTDDRGRNNDDHNRSISMQFRKDGHHSAVQRNARTIARAQSFRDEEQNKRRLELQRRIEETRRKLQNVRLQFQL